MLLGFAVFGTVFLFSFSKKRARSCTVTKEAMRFF